MHFKSKKFLVFLFILLLFWFFILFIECVNLYSIKGIAEITKQSSQQNENSYYEPVFFSEEPSFTSDFPGPSEMISYAKSHNFESLYNNLISGLDKESVDTVNRILTRFQQINSGESAQFTAKELRELDLLRRNFKVLKLNENCFVWNNYFLPIDHFEPSVMLYQNGITNIKDVQKLKNKDIIDVGGFIGDSALIFSDYTNKKVYSFEPSSKNFDLMQKTISMNKKNNIVPVKFGLGSKVQNANIPLEISSSLKTDQSQSEKFSGDKSENVKIIPLDKFASENKLDVGLIKVDIEGNEQDFLKGAENTIKTQKPFLLISIYHNPSDFFNIKPMIESWNLGYTFKIVKCTDGQICAETLLVASPEGK